MLDHPLAAQVTVERAQARGLARQRGRRDRWALAGARGQLGQERREVAVPGLPHVQPAAVEELPELEQVRAIGLERVAREAPLELEVGEEVERQPLELGARPQ